MQIVIDGVTIDVDNMNITSKNNINQYGMKGMSEHTFSFDCMYEIKMTQKTIKLEIFNTPYRLHGTAYITSYTRESNGLFSYSGIFERYEVEKIESDNKYILIRELKKYDISQVLN